jgi:hypothetical protein
VTELGGVSLYGETSPGLCEACQVDGCLDCLNYYKRCEGCKTGYGPTERYEMPQRRRLLQDTGADETNSDYASGGDYEYDDDLNTADYVESNSFASCSKCSDDRCGICQEVYTTCNGYITDCDKSVIEVGKATRVSVDDIDQCEGGPGFNGNGYTSKRTYTIVDGDCAECGAKSIGYSWYWYPLDMATGDVATYCWMDGQMRSIAANAFTGSDGCEYPGTMTLELTNLCYSSNRGVAFNVDATFKGIYCGQTKTIYVNGESIFGPVWEKLESGDKDAITWTYAATAGKDSSATTSSTTPSSITSSPNAPTPTKDDSTELSAGSATVIATSPGIIATTSSSALVAIMLLA